MVSVLGLPLPPAPVVPMPIDYLLTGLAVHNPPIEIVPMSKEGCCVSCGYSYCDTLLECVRPWETPCPELINPFDPAHEDFKKGVIVTPLLK